MKVLYSMELAGFAVGFAIVSLSWNKGVEFIIPIYWVLLAIVIQLALQKKSWTVEQVSSVNALTYIEKSMDLVDFIGFSNFCGCHLSSAVKNAIQLLEDNFIPLFLAELTPLLDCLHIFIFEYFFFIYSMVLSLEPSSIMISSKFWYV